VIALGNLNFRIIVSKLLPPLPNIALITSEGLILTDPKKMSRTRKITNTNSRVEKMSLVLLPEICSDGNPPCFFKCTVLIEFSVIS
jgi:hypothetical protein